MRTDIETRVRHTRLPDDKVVVQVGFTPRFESPQTPTINVLVDLSRSMGIGRGSRRAWAIKSLEAMVRGLHDRPQTYIRIIAYDDRATILYEGTVRDVNLHGIQQSMNTGFGRGTKAFKAVDLLPQGREGEAAAQSVLLLTDGEDDSERTGLGNVKDAIIDRVYGGNVQQANIVAVGIGDDYIDSFLRILADDKVFPVRCADELVSLCTGLLPYLSGRKDFSSNLTIGERPHVWSRPLASTCLDGHSEVLSLPVNGGSLSVRLTVESPGMEDFSMERTLTTEELQRHNPTLLAESARGKLSEIELSTQLSRPRKMEALERWIGFVASVQNSIRSREGLTDEHSPLVGCLFRLRQVLRELQQVDYQVSLANSTFGRTFAGSVSLGMSDLAALAGLTMVAGEVGISMEQFEAETEDLECPVMQARICGKVVDLRLENGASQYFSWQGLSGYCRALGAGPDFPHPLTRRLISREVLKDASGIATATNAYRKKIMEALLHRQMTDEQRAKFLQGLGWTTRQEGAGLAEITEVSVPDRVTEALEGSDMTDEQPAEVPQGLDEAARQERLTPARIPEYSSHDSAKFQIDKKGRELKDRGFDSEGRALIRLADNFDNPNVTPQQKINIERLLHRNIKLKLHRKGWKRCAQIGVVSMQTLSGIGAVLGAINCLVGKTRCTSGRYSMFPPTETEKLLRDLAASTAPEGSTREASQREYHQRPG